MAIQGNGRVSRRAVLDDILQGFLHDPVKSQGDFPWKRCRDVLALNVNRDAMPVGQLLTEPGRRLGQSQEFESRGVKVVRQRPEIGHDIRNLLADFPDPLLEIGR